MIVIEIRPDRRGWKVFEAPGVEPVFLEKDQASNYASNRASFRSGEIRVLDLIGNVEHAIRFSEAPCVFAAAKHIGLKSTMPLSGVLLNSLCTEIRNLSHRKKHDETHKIKPEPSLAQSEQLVHGCMRLYEQPTTKGQGPANYRLHRD